MKSILFNERYGLRSAVIAGRKTMTRRVSEKQRYQVGEIVAIAQPYCELGKTTFRGKPGWLNPMFISPTLMLHQIRITSVRIERLQDISDEDCLREGVRKLESDGCPIMFTFDGWSFKNKVNRCTDSPKEAFEALFKKLSGKKAWDDNPWVFAYEFELVK